MLTATFYFLSKLLLLTKVSINRFLHVHMVMVVVCVLSVPLGEPGLLSHFFTSQEKWMGYIIFADLKEKMAGVMLTL